MVSTNRPDIKSLISGHFVDNPASGRVMEKCGFVPTGETCIDANQYQGENRPIIVDGWLARKLKCVTKTGALLDSVADICFVACCVWKLLPILELPQWLWLWAGVIIGINENERFAMHSVMKFPQALLLARTGHMVTAVTM